MCRLKMSSWRRSGGGAVGAGRRGGRSRQWSSTRCAASRFAPAQVVAVAASGRGRCTSGSWRRAAARQWSLELARCVVSGCDPASVPLHARLVFTPSYGHGLGCGYGWALKMAGTLDTIEEDESPRLCPCGLNISCLGAHRHLPMVLSTIFLPPSD